MATKKEEKNELMIMQPLINAQQALTVVAQLQGFVKDLLKKDYDFGVIPGTKKNTLLKPGAEKLNKVYGFVPRDVIITAVVEDWEKEPALFDYTIKTILVDREDNIVGIGLGSCNSWESKYKYRNAARTCPECNAEALCKSKYPDKNTGDMGWYCYDKKGGCGTKYHSEAPEIINQEVGKKENADIADQKNTILKMAKKRSLIDATINATMSSDLFTQDVEDFESFNVTVADGAEPDARVTAEVVDEKKPSAPQSNTSKGTTTTTQTRTSSGGTASPKLQGSQPATSAASQAGTQQSQTATATQNGASVDPKPTGTPISNAGSGTTSSAGALSAEIEDAIHAAVTYMTQNQEAVAVPPRESAQMLLKLFKLRAGNDEVAKNQFNTYLDEKHNVNRDNPGNYTWAVFNQTIIDFKG